MHLPQSCTHLKILLVGEALAPAVYLLPLISDAGLEPQCRGLDCTTTSAAHGSLEGKVRGNWKKLHHWKAESALIPNILKFIYVPRGLFE